MAALLGANTITALSPEYEPIQYLRRSSSMCGQRQPKNFTHDIPMQLQKFFDAVLGFSLNTQGQLQKLKMAQGFVDRKFAQYLKVLNHLIEARSHLEINHDILEIYLEKEKEIKEYIHRKLLPVDENDTSH